MWLLILVKYWTIPLNLMDFGFFPITFSFDKVEIRASLEDIILLNKEKSVTILSRKRMGGYLLVGDWIVALVWSNQ